MISASTVSTNGSSGGSEATRPVRSAVLAVAVGRGPGGTGRPYPAAERGGEVALRHPGPGPHRPAGQPHVTSGQLGHKPRRQVRLDRQPGVDREPPLVVGPLRRQRVERHRPERAAGSLRHACSAVGEVNARTWVRLPVVHVPQPIGARPARASADTGSRARRGRGCGNRAPGRTPRAPRASPPRPRWPVPTRSTATPSVLWRSTSLARIASNSLATRATRQRGHQQPAGHHGSTIAYVMVASMAQSPRHATARSAGPFPRDALPPAACGAAALLAVMPASVRRSRRTPAAAAARTCASNRRRRRPSADAPWPQQRYDLAALSQITDGAGVTVAVVDSGVDASQPAARRRGQAGARHARPAAATAGRTASATAPPSPASSRPARVTGVGPARPRAGRRGSCRSG